MKFNIRSILVLSALLTFALSWSWVCLDDYLSFRSYYEKLINREKVILENDDLKEFELISKIRQLDSNNDTNLDEIKEVISLDPENSYLQLILLDHMCRSFTDSHYTMQDKIDVLNKFAELEKYDTYRAETIEICSRNIPDGNRKIIINLLNSVNINDSIYFVTLFLKDYRKTIADSITNKNYDEAERLLKEYTKWTDSLMRKVCTYYSIQHITSMSYQLLKDETIGPYLESPYHDKAALEKLTEIWHFRYLEKISNPDRIKRKNLKDFSSTSAYGNFWVHLKHSNLKREDLSYGRYVEYSSFEMLILAVFSIIIIAIIFIIATVFYLNSKNRKNINPFKLAFNNLLKFELKYLLIPLFIYGLWRISPWSCYHNGMEIRSAVFLAEILILLFALLVFSTWKLACEVSPIKKQMKIDPEDRMDIIEKLFFLVIAGCILNWLFISNINHEIKDIFFINVILNKLYIQNCCTPRNWLYFLNLESMVLVAYLIPFYWKACVFFLNLLKVRSKTFFRLIPIISSHLCIVLFIISLYSFFVLRTIEKSSYKKDKFTTIQKGESTAGFERQVVNKLKAKYLLWYPEVPK